MPIDTPNREADPVTLESFVAPCKLKQEGGLFIPYYNAGSTAYITGEPVVLMGRVCIVQKTILPGKLGTLVADWIVDALLDTSHTGNITQGDLIYWDTDVNVVTEIESGDATSGLGGAVHGSAPTNGFILGRAVQIGPATSGVVAGTGSTRVRVVSVPGAPTEYSGS
jgi:hypothetical protein